MIDINYKIYRENIWKVHPPQIYLLEDQQQLVSSLISYKSISSKNHHTLKHASKFHICSCDRKRDVTQSENNKKIPHTCSFQNNSI